MKSEDSRDRATSAAPKEKPMIAFTEVQSPPEEMAASQDNSPTPSRARLSVEDEQRLARAWREDGDVAARERLVTANLGLVVAIAQRYRNSGVPLEELIAEGNLGLLNAVDGFDPDCGSRLSTYAAYWIRQGIGRAFAANSPRGRLTSRDRQDLAALERASREHYSRTCEMPTVAELASDLGWSTERVGECRSMFVAFARPHSLDQPQGASPMPRGHAADEGAPFELADAGTREQVQRLLSGLTPLEREAVEFRFGLHGGEPQNVQAIARALDRPSGEVRLALRTAMAKLLRDGRRVRPAHPNGDEPSQERGPR